MRFYHAENVHNMALQKLVNVVSPVKCSSVYSLPKEVKEVLKKVVLVPQRSRSPPLPKEHLPRKIPRHQVLRKVSVVVKRRVLKIGVALELI